MGRKSSDREQRSFDFGPPARAAQLDALDKWEAPARAGGVSGVALKGVLRAIDSACRGGWGWPGEATLMVAAGLGSERQVRRAVRALQDLGLLVVKRRTSGDGRKTFNHYRICFANMLPEEIGDVDSGRWSGRRPNLHQPDFLDDQPDFLDDQPDFSCISTGLGSPPKRIEAQEPPPPTPATATGATTGLDTGRGWAAAEIALCRVGVELKLPAIQSAVSAGLDPDTVVRIVQTYEANRAIAPALLRGPGAIQFRLAKGAWPVPGVREPEEIAAEQARRVERQRVKVEADSRDATAGQALQERYRRLEAAHGRKLDALPGELRRALERRVVPPGIPPRCCRFEMLEALEQEGSET
jgi:hypothetical protein